MPRLLDPVLAQALERANPNVAHFVEVNAPDVAQVLRRSDQFLLPVSQAPVNSIVADPAGSLTIVTTTATLASFPVVDDFTTTHIAKVGLADDRVRGLSWVVNPAFGRAVLQSFTAHVARKTTSVRNHLALQIYRRQRVDVAVIFTPILPHAVLWVNTEARWTMSSGFVADATFDLSDLHVEVGSAGAEQEDYYFVLEAVDAQDDDLFLWARDRTTAHAVANVGTFADRRWVRLPGTASFAWFEDLTLPAAVPTASITVAAHVATAQAVYAITLPTVPTAASSGRIVFERREPTGTSATLELSTAGSGGPWVVVKDGDPVTVKQLGYHLRATLNASAGGRVAPAIAAMGIEFRIPVDVTAEAIVEPVAQQIDVPFLAASIGEGKVTVMRTGRRDYRDVASDLATQSAVSRLEMDVRLGSRHPLVTRDRWMLIDRAFVNNRSGNATGEEFSLLSYRKVLKQKVPQRSESIDTVRNVVSQTTVGGTTQLLLDGAALPGSTNPDAYRDQNYYIRVQRSTQAGVLTGYTQRIDNNSGTHTLVFFDLLPGTFAAGDVVEVHSGQYSQAGLKWVDADPADVWWELNTVHCAVPPERLGSAVFGRHSRSGLPPRVTDRAPGDPDTQAKLLVTLSLHEAEEAAGLIDQLSFIMGGATVEIGGQIVFRQIYPLRDPDGLVVVPGEPIAATFDARTLVGLDTPVGLEQRITALACDYGLDTTATTKDAAAALTTNFVDVDALVSLDRQPVDELAAAAIPDNIARWCYNTADEGEYLAGMLTQQVVRAASTGLRVWTWGNTEAKPQLVAGDRVSVITDQYTDYDPARSVPVRGPFAYPLVLISVEGGGRQFRGYMLGLTDAVQVRGGPGTLANDDGKGNADILRVSSTESADGKQRVFTLTLGAAVDTVHVHYRTVPINITGDAFDFSGEEDVTESPTLLILNRVVGSDTVTFSLPHPARGFKGAGRLVPLGHAPQFLEGGSWPFAVDAAPPAVNAKIHTARVGAVGSASIDIAFGPSDGPVDVQVLVDTLTTSTLLVSKSMAAPGTLDVISDPALGALALPAGKDSIGLRVVITDVSGQPWGFGPALLNRDPLPNGTPAIKNYRPDPAIILPFDPDTDQIRYTAHDGRVKTFNAAALLAGSPLTLTVGVTPFDDASLEPALAVDETRTAAKIEYQGGGQWVTMWTGDLHGQPSNPPTADVRTEFNAARDAANVFVRPSTSVNEKLHVYYREGSTDTALEWVACVSAGDPTPLAVIAGTQLGPANFFRRVDGVGSPSAKLAAIPLVRDQLATHGVMIEGVDSGVQSPWLDVVLSLMEKPWNESFELSFDVATRKLTAIIVAGAHVASEGLLLADNDAFSAPIVLSGNVSDGGTLKLETTLSAGQLGKVWYGKVTPFNAASLSGLNGEVQKASVAVPAVYTVDPVATENTATSTGTLTLTVADPGGVIDPTLRIRFYVTVNGVRALVNATSAPAGSGTTGDFVYSFTLDPKHNVKVEPLVKFVDGSTSILGAWTFDSDKLANVLSAVPSIDNQTATINCTFDTDAVVGAATARFRINGGSFTTFAVAAALTGTFNVTLSGTAPQTIDIQGQDSDGNWGPSLTIKVGTYDVPAPNITVSIDPISGNTAGQASVSFRIDLPPNARSAYYKVVTGPSAVQPSDATTISTGTLVNATGVLPVINAATVNLGDLIEVVAVPFTGASGAGTQLPSAHARSAYTTFGKTTTLGWYRTAWQPASAAPDYTVDANENILNPATGSSVVRRRFRIPALLPPGVKLSSATFTVGWSTATNPLGSFTVGVDAAAGSNINFGSASYGSAPQTITVSLASTVIASGNTINLFGNFINAVSAAADGGQAYLGDASLTYVTPSQDKLV